MKLSTRAWAGKVSTAEGLQEISEARRAYAEKKGVSTDRVGVRFVRGSSQFYVLPSRHLVGRMNND